jgi:hypothetical protein
MKLPLNYAILFYFTKHSEGDADSVIEVLKPEYGSYRSFKKKGVIESLMTSKENGILEEVRAELVCADDANSAKGVNGVNSVDRSRRISQEDELRVWYRLTDYGRDLVERFL